MILLHFLKIFIAIILLFIVCNDIYVLKKKLQVPNFQWAVANTDIGHIRVICEF